MKLDLNRRSKKQIHLSLALASLIGLSSCQMKKNLDEMHEATVAVSATSGRLENQTVEMYDALKQGDSLTARRNGLVALSEAADPSKKISEAAKYFMSFEFQLWSASGQDTAERRQELLATGAKEFLREVQEFIEPNQVDPKPTAQAGDRNQNLNAISVALHFINPKQTEMLHRNPGYKEVSMYSIIKDGLAAGAEIAAGKKTLRDFPAHVREVLVYERVATLLVQARYNYYGAMALGKVTPIRSASPHLKMIGLETSLPNQIRMRYQPWALDISKVGATELEETARYLEGGLKAFDFMRSVGIEPRLNRDLAKIYKNMKPSQAVSADVSSVRAYRAMRAKDTSLPPLKAHTVASVSLFELMRVYAGSASNPKIVLPENARTAKATPQVESKH